MTFLSEKIIVIIYIYRYNVFREFSEPIRFGSIDASMEILTS